MVIITPDKFPFIFLKEKKRLSPSAGALKVQMRNNKKVQKMVSQKIFGFPEDSRTGRKKGNVKLLVVDGRKCDSSCGVSGYGCKIMARPAKNSVGPPTLLRLHFFLVKPHFPSICFYFNDYIEKKVTATRSLLHHQNYIVSHHYRFTQVAR